MSEELLADVRGGVMRLTINREARRNALNKAVIDGIAAGFTTASEDKSIRAIVITGAGSQAFCAGADLQGDSFKMTTAEPTLGFANLMRQARRLNVPLIARVNGACMAGGMGLLALCDLAVAAEGAKFGLPEVKVGVFPSQVLTVLQHLVGRRNLAELCITGEPITAAEAREMGLINHVTPDLDAKLDWLLARVLDKSPTAIRRCLYTMKHIQSMAFEESMAFTESQIVLTSMSDDAKEGTAAFREKRKPQWPGT